MEKKLEEIYIKLGEILEEKKSVQKKATVYEDIFKSEDIKFNGHILSEKDEYTKECYLTFLALLFGEKISQEKLKKFRLITNSVTNLTSEYFIAKARELDSKKLRELLEFLDYQEIKENLLLDMLIVSAITEETEQLSKMIQILKIEKGILKVMCQLAKDILEECEEKVVTRHKKIHGSVFYSNLFFDKVYPPGYYRAIKIDHRTKNLVLDSKFKKILIDGLEGKLVVERCEIQGRIMINPGISLKIQNSHFEIEFLTVTEIEEKLFENIPELNYKNVYSYHSSNSFWEIRNTATNISEIKRRILTKKFENAIRKNKKNLIERLIFNNESENISIDEETLVTIKFFDCSITI